MSRPTNIRFTGFSLIVLQKCISGDPNDPSRDANGENPLFFYTYTEHDKMGFVRVNDITLGSFRVHVSHDSKDKSIKMSGQRWFELRSGGRWEPIPEAEYNKLLEEWMDIVTMPDATYEKWRET